MNRKSIFLATLLIILLAAGVYVYRLVWGRPFSIDHFADRYLLLWGSQFPENMTLLGFIENTPLDFHSDRLTDLSPPAQQDRLKTLGKQREIFREYDRKSFSGQQKITYDVLGWSLEAEHRLSRFPYHFSNVSYVGPYPANTTEGLQIYPLVILDELQQVVDADSAHRFLARVHALPAYLESLADALRYRATLGVVPPKIIVKQLMAEADRLINTPVEDWSIRRTLLAHLSELELGESDIDSMLAEIDESIESGLIPAYGSYRGVLDELETQAPQEVGVWTLPDGQAYYQALLNLHTSSDLDPQAIHQIGLRRVAELEIEMTGYLDELGVSQGNLTERLLEFSQSELARYPEDDDVKILVLDDYREMAERLIEGVSPAFQDLPTQALEVHAVAEYKQDTAPGAYYSPPSIDGNRPGIFYVNLRKPGDVERQGMLTLAAHEAVPGHHFQIATAHSLQGLPMYRNVVFFTAYGEGWALYAERLVYELGLHDIVSNLGRVQSEMFRAVRLVVDTGIHAKKWPRQRAIDYMLQYTGIPESDVIPEIDRYIVMPAQACAYMIGMLEILAMREEAQDLLQEGFNLGEFHHIVLGNGQLPLQVLREQVRQMGDTVANRVPPN